VPFYSFGEKIAARSSDGTTFSLARSYETFADIVHSGGAAWDLGARESGVRNGPSQPIPWDAEWFEDNKCRALYGLERAGQPATMEVRFSLSRVKLTSSRSSLLDAVKGAGFGFGWPIAVVLNNDEYGARPSEDGIYANVSEASRYHYWALRGDGDFFAMRSLSEDDEGARDRIFFDTRIVQITETLLYCERLYGRLEVAPRSEVRIIIEHAGLENRQLKSADRARIRAVRRPSDVDRAKASIEVVIGRIESDLVELVKTIAEPLFEIFDFHRFDDSVYRGLVDHVISRKAK
jgi:hypothetical protein